MKNRGHCSDFSFYIITDLWSMKASDICAKLVKYFESLHDGDLTLIGLQPKMCPAGIWTVGYGRALRDAKGNFLSGIENKAKAYAMYPNLSVADAERMLSEDLAEFSVKVEKVLARFGVKLSQYQFDAVVSLCYNCGTGALVDNKTGMPLSVLRAILNHNIGIEAAFSLWNKSNKKTLPGLVKRRKVEAYLYVNGKLNFAA